MNVEAFISEARALGFQIKEVSESKLVVLDYHFSDMYTSVDVIIRDGQIRIMSPKGNYILLESAKDLIAHNYFEYFLPKLEKHPEIVNRIPIFWENLFKMAGLFDERNEEFKIARHKAIFERLKEHFGLACGIKDMSLWNDVAREFPECVYYVPAHRAVLCHKDELNQKQLVSPGHSWALDMSGIKEFIVNGDAYTEEDNGFFLAQAEIKGISLIHIIKLFGKNLSDSTLSFAGEQEIILLEVITLNEVKFTTAKEQNFKLPASITTYQDDY